jgi:tetratricopeptide (TPR) repeat protein
MPADVDLVRGGLQFHRYGRLAEAEVLYRQALAENPQNAAAWHFLGVIAQERGQHAVSLELIGRALTLQPDYAEAHSDLGNALKAQQQVQAAADCYRRALSLKPALVEARFHLANCLFEQGQFDEAIGGYQAVVEQRPDHAPAWNNLGNALFKRGRFEDALQPYQEAVRLNLDDAETHYNLGNLLYLLGHIDDALAEEEKAIDLKPQFAEARFRRATLLLLKGDFARRWHEYEWRWEASGVPRPALSPPQWQGEPLARKTILLHTEQALGDAIQFIRYAAVLNEQGAQVIAACHPALVPLLTLARGVDEVVSELTDEMRFDFHAPLLSLPGILGTTLATIPGSVPYLQGDSALVARWRERLASVRGFRIGINWRGRGGEGVLAMRDIPARWFASLAEVPGVRLINLQQGPARHELREEPGDSRLIDFGDELDTAHGAFMDTAAIMQSLDLVITSDTSIAHLAGALGVPVWVALPLAPDWRWLLERRDSPWYPTMRLYRQPRPGDWASVFEEIRADLRATLKLK